MCTNFKNKTAKDGSVVVGRTMEFPPLMPWILAALPADYEGSATLPKDETSAPMTWKATHGIVGMACFGKSNWLADAMSTAGVSAHLLYMPGGYCTYQDFKGDGSDLSELDLIAFLLGTCASLAEVRKAVAKVNVFGVDPGMGFFPPVHVLMHDKDDSLAIEFHSEGARVVDNPIGVGTNSPYMDWHHTNLNNFVGLSTSNPSAIKIDNVEITALGQGQGLMGLPGDLTPASRFVRAVTQVTASDQPADGHESEQLALHILNNFDITPGLLREPGPDGKLVDEVTSWSTIANLTGLRYCYRTIDDPTTYAVELGTTDFTKPARTGDLPTRGEFAAASV